MKDRMRKSTIEAGPEFKKKNGRSFKTTAERTQGHDSGAGDEAAATGKRLRGMPPGPGKKLPGAQTPSPFMAKNSEGASHRAVEPRGPARLSGAGKSLAKVQAWVNGKAKSYC